MAALATASIDQSNLIKGGNVSTNLTLIKYQLAADGRYLEESGERIASTFISEEILHDLIEITPLAKLTIYEEEGSDESSEADCLQNEKIFESLNFVKTQFINLISEAKISELESADESLIKSISDFRSITNLYYLLEIKHDKYQSDDSVVVKMG